MKFKFLSFAFGLFLWGCAYFLSENYDEQVKPYEVSNYNVAETLATVINDSI